MIGGAYDELIMLLSSGISQRRLYSAGHPRVATCSENLARQLAALLVAGRESLFIGVADGKLLHRGRYLVGSTIVGRRLIGFAENLHSGGFLFRAGIDAAELRQFLSLAAELAEPVASLAAARALFESRGLRRVELSPPFEDAGWFGQSGEADECGWGDDPVDARHIETLLRTYQSLFHTVETTHAGAHGGAGVDVDSARAASEQMMQSCDGTLTDLMQVVRYPDPDSYTIGHSVRVSMIAVLVGQRLGLQPAALTELGAAALLHDIGKARIPHEILHKPGRLNANDWRIVMEHCAAGAMMLLESHRAGPLAIAAAWGHHMRHDGGGYPAGRPWTVRSDVTELLHLCDVFEALTAVRPYKPARTPRRAFELMLEDPGEFDPRMLAVFAGALGVYPPGSRVALSSGQQGVVVAAGRELARPQVRLTHDRGGRALEPAARAVVDLGDEAAQALAITALLQDGIR